MERLNHEAWEHEYLEVIETVREVIGLGGLPQEPSFLPAGELARKIMASLSDGEPVQLGELARRVGKWETTGVCRQLRILSGQGKVVRGDVKGTWRIVKHEK